MTGPARDHGGRLDEAAARFGGTREDWLDLSTGINPVPYPIPELPAEVWTALPDRAATSALEHAARQFWSVPESAEIVFASGASALIARLPDLLNGAAHIPGPTYNEYAAAFGARAGADPSAPIHIHVHPNNPDGRMAPDLSATSDWTILDESFCDTDPDQSRVALTASGRVAVLKSFGKFWGLAGLRLGALIAAPGLASRMRASLGPWPVSGPALAIGNVALRDSVWAARSRIRLAADARRLDSLLGEAGARCVGGTSLFRLYDIHDATGWHERLARARILSRIFPYNPRWLRLGLPPEDGWPRLARALGLDHGTAGGATSRTVRSATSGVPPAR